MDIFELVEYRNFGWNAITLCALATLFFTIFEAAGLIAQNRIIWKNKSGKSIANKLFIYYAYMFAIFFLYGLAKQEGAAIINGFLFLFFIPILIGLRKFNKFGQGDKALAAIGAIFLAGMLTLPFKELIFTGFSFGGILVLFAQAWEIYKEKSPGVVEINLLAIYFISTLFWTVYSWAIFDLPLMVITSLSLCILGLIIILWVYYYNLEQRKIYSINPGRKIL